MNVCIVGDGLVSLTLAKALVSQGIYVDIFSDQKVNKIDKSRTLALSKANIDFFNKNILNIDKFLWDINKIEIYSESLKNEKLLNFKNDKKQLFSIIRNYELYNYLFLSLIKNNFFKKKKDYKKLKIKNYNLIINCDINSSFTKKYFHNKLSKNYNSFAHTTIIDHKKLINNNTAVQIFTKRGPIAFLPLSNIKTSVVYSVRGFNKINLENLIKKYNTKYSNIRINQISSFELKSSSVLIKPSSKF